MNCSRRVRCSPFTLALVTVLLTINLALPGVVYARPAASLSRGADLVPAGQQPSPTVPPRPTLTPTPEPQATPTPGPNGSPTQEPPPSPTAEPTVPPTEPPPVPPAAPEQPAAPPPTPSPTSQPVVLLPETGLSANHLYLAALIAILASSVVLMLIAHRFQPQNRD